MSLTITVKRSTRENFGRRKTAWRVNLEFSSWNLSVEQFAFLFTPVKAIRVFNENWKR